MLKLDLQFFAEDDLDLDSMLEEFENEWTDEEVSEDDHVDVQADTEDDQDVEVSQDQPEETPQPEPNPNDSDAEKRNRAFADLRRQADENRKYAEFMAKIAQDAGVSPEELLAQYEQRQLAQEAERQQVPLEYFKESRETASRLTMLEEQLRTERLDRQIQSVSSKYGANDDSIRDTFTYMLQAGVDPRTTDNVDFEKFYRAANLDSIIAKEVESARQKDLASKKERQQSAAIGNGTSVSPSSGDLSDEEVDAILKSMDIRI
jgi:hypothetical protein